MRNALVLATALVSTVALSACGSSKGKSKIAAAKATGNAQVIHDATKSAMADSAKLIQKLETDHRYYGMTKFGVAGFHNRLAQSTKETLFENRSVEENQKILGLLREINTTNKEAAKGGKGITEKQQAKAKALADASAKCIDDIQKDLKSAEQKEVNKKKAAEEIKNNKGSYNSLIDPTMYFPG